MANPNKTVKKAKREITNLSTIDQKNPSMAEDINKLQKGHMSAKEFAEKWNPQLLVNENKS